MKRTPGPAPLRGVIEGFYGSSWPVDVRARYARWLADLGLNCYLYAPKADPYLRRAWTGHWPDREWSALRDLAVHYRQAGVMFGIGLSPFSLYADYGQEQRGRLRDKVERLNALEAPLLAILFDDMPGEQADLAARQAEIINDCLHWSCAERLVVCPTYYSYDAVLERVFGIRPEGYWSDLGSALPASVDIFWTGDKVCAETLQASDLIAINTEFRRPVTLWDNYPVNDGAVRSHHLYLDPPPARDAGNLPGVSRGHLCNGMNQPWLTLPALAGLAHLYDPSLDTHGWLSETLGEATHVCLQRDAPLFRELSREQLLDSYGAALLQEYRTLATPAAREVVSWLQGDFAFDPACLND